MKNLFKLMGLISSIDMDNLKREDIEKVVNMALNLTEEELKLLPPEITLTINELKTISKKETTKDKPTSNFIEVIKMNEKEIKSDVDRGKEYGLLMFSNYNKLINGTTLVIINEKSNGGLIVGKKSDDALNCLKIANKEKQISVIKTETVAGLQMLSIQINDAKTENKNKFTL